MFSFNSPFGACGTCEGLGKMMDFDPRLVVPDPSIAIINGGIAPLEKNAKHGFGNKFYRGAITTRFL